MTDKQKEGRTPLHTLRAQIIAVSEAKTTYGHSIKVWVYTGDMIPSAENLKPRSLQRMSNNNENNETEDSTKVEKEKQDK